VNLDPTRPTGEGSQRGLQGHERDSWRRICEQRSYQQVHALAYPEAHSSPILASTRGDSLEACYLEVVDYARRLLSEHWLEVEAVARALERCGALDGETFQQELERQKN
jgi:hypothetical protein